VGIDGIKAYIVSLKGGGIGWQEGQEGQEQRCVCVSLGQNCKWPFLFFGLI
jgi:hypothetical protein